MAGKNTTIIQIIAEMINKVTKPANQISRSINKISREQQVLNKTSERLGMGTRQVQNAMRDANIELRKSGRFYDTITQKSIKQNDAFKRLHHSSRRFKMEYLSLMFAGMAIERVFGGILRTQLQLWGLTEGFSATLSVLMIPVMQDLSAALWPVLTRLQDLSPLMKKAFGWFVVGGFVIGLFTMIVGMAVLAFGGLQSVLGVTGVIATLKAFGIIVGKVSLVLVGLGFVVWGVVTIIDNWGKSTNKVIRGVGATILGLGLILAAFIGWWALIPIAVGAAVLLIAKHWGKLPGWLQKIFIGIYVLAEALGKTLYNLLIKPMITFAKVAWKILTGDFVGAWDVAKDAMFSLDDPFRNIGSRYDELVDQSAKYALEQKADLDAVSNGATSTAQTIDDTMNASLSNVTSYLNTTSANALGITSDMEENWTNMATLNSTEAMKMVGNINAALDLIPTEVVTVHRIVEEKGSGGEVKGGKKFGPAVSSLGALLGLPLVSKKYPFMQHGGIVPGSPGQAVPVMAHGGEEVIPYGKTNPSIIVNQTLNVNVADKREFETLIKNNNTRLVEDVRRLVQD